MQRQRMVSHMCKAVEACRAVRCAHVQPSHAPAAAYIQPEPSLLQPIPPAQAAHRGTACTPALRAHLTAAATCSAEVGQTTARATAVLSLFHT